ncbi:hypothetical protein [Nevskia sp.]|uniref:hypothetical protein n=1 Tax=Nevskia sp. TaxID=1929292 RepID=UPI0025F28902|nr:hypothetical protein [Nevskia sp.]
MAASIARLASEYIENSRSVGIVLELAQVQQQAMDALRFYAAYGPVASIPGGAANSAELRTLTEDTVLTVGEWGIVRPLFVLYVERENALHLESAESLGVQVYGRRSSEVTQDITQAEELVRFSAFSRPIIGV